MSETIREPGPNGGSAVLLYDGDCGFCSRSVQFVLRHDRRSALRFASLASAFGRRVLEQEPGLRGVDSMVWVELDAQGGPRRTRVRSDAVLEVGRYLRGGWRALAAVAGIVPRPWRDAAYDWMARHRRQLGGARACLVVPPSQRHRFLDAV